jgi:hypothetical protein
MPIDWSKPIEWSNGESSGVEFEPTPATFEVIACTEWVDNTDETTVVVMSNGVILGCEDEGYPTIRNRAG